jgi:hypothetical protein
MNAKRLRRVLTSVILVIVLVVIIGIIYLFSPNELGLTGFDLFIGRHPKPQTLRANILAVADSFFKNHTNLYGLGNEHQPVIDYSKSSKIRALGYRSSFYYYCWNIYLPYSFPAQSGEAGTVIIQLSDATQGQGHNLQKFRVIRAILTDSQGRVTKTIDVP